MPNLQDASQSQKLIFWIGSTAVAILLGVGMPLYQGIHLKFEGQQEQIDDNRNKIWEQQRTSVTEETLSRRFAEIMQIVDTKIDSIQSLQKEQSRQLDLLIKSQDSFQKDIRAALQDKADKE